MTTRNRSARQSDQTRRAKVQDSTEAKYTTPLVIAGGALLAFPFVEGFSTMSAASFFGLAVFAVSVSVFTIAFNEKLRCSR